MTHKAIACFDARSALTLDMCPFRLMRRWTEIKLDALLKKLALQITRLMLLIYSVIVMCSTPLKKVIRLPYPYWRTIVAQQGSFGEGHSFA